MSNIYIAFDPSDVDQLFELHEAMRRENVADTFRSADADAELPKIDDMERLAEASAVILLASRASLGSKGVRQEIELASKLNKPLLVLFLDNEKPRSKWANLLAEAREFDLVKDPENACNEVAKAAREIYEDRCPVVAVMNLKGGVGKTTITSQLFGYLQKEEKSRILLIDFDPQFNLSQFFLTREETDQRTEKDQSVLALFEPSLITSSVYQSPALDWTTFNDGIFSPPATADIVRPLIPREELNGALDIIPGQFELTKYAFLDDAEALATAEQNLQQSIDFYRKDYDLIVIDTNPSASFLTRAILGVSDHILAPVRPNEFSLRGLRLLEMILTRFCAEEDRPEVSVLFNGVPKSQQNQFEQDARDGVYNKDVGFVLSEKLLASALYQSGHLDLKAEIAHENPVGRLAAYSARGPFANDLRRRLAMITRELKEAIEKDRR